MLICPLHTIGLGSGVLLVHPSVNNCLGSGDGTQCEKVHVRREFLVETATTPLVPFLGSANNNLFGTNTKPPDIYF